MQNVISGVQHQTTDANDRYNAEEDDNFDQKLRGEILQKGGGIVEE